MDLTTAYSFTGLVADATPSSTNVTNDVQVGENLSRVTYSPTSDYVYTFLVTAAAAGNVATLTLTSGAVAQTTGSPVLTDTAEDFEGVALPTLATIYGIQVRVTVSDSTSIVIGGTFGMAATLRDAGDVLQLSTSTTGLTAANTLTVTFTDGDDGAGSPTASAVEITVIGKT